MGRLLGWKKRLALGDIPKAKTCETYKDKNGKTRYKGTAALRKTEYLNFVMGIYIVFYGFPDLDTWYYSTDQIDFDFSLIYTPIQTSILLHPAEGVSCEIRIQACGPI